MGAWHKDVIKPSVVKAELNVSHRLCHNLSVQSSVSYSCLLRGQKEEEEEGERGKRTGREAEDSFA